MFKRLTTSILFCILPLCSSLMTLNAQVLQEISGGGSVGILSVAETQKHLKMIEEARTLKQKVKAVKILGSFGKGPLTYFENEVRKDMLMGLRRVHPLMGETDASARAAACSYLRLFKSESFPLALLYIGPERSRAVRQDAFYCALQLKSIGPTQLPPALIEVRKDPILKIRLLADLLFVLSEETNTETVDTALRLLSRWDIMYQTEGPDAISIAGYSFYSFSSRFSKDEKFLSLALSRLKSPEQGQEFLNKRAFKVNFLLLLRGIFWALPAKKKFEMEKNYLPFFKRMLYDENHEVKAVALSILTYFYPQNGRQLVGRIEELQKVNHLLVQRFSAYALFRHKPSARSRLTGKILWFERMRIIEPKYYWNLNRPRAILKYGLTPDHKKAVPAIINEAKQKNRFIPGRVNFLIELLGKIRSPEAIPFLNKCLKSPELAQDARSALDKLEQHSKKKRPYTNK